MVRKIWLYMWLFSLIVNLAEPVWLICSGWKLLKDPPRNRELISYCSSWARKSWDTWSFAQECCGKLSLGTGIMMAIFVIAIQLALPYFRDAEGAVWTWFGVFVADVFIACVIVIVVEVKLRRNFDKYGFRRNREDLS